MNLIRLKSSVSYSHISIKIFRINLEIPCPPGTYSFGSQTSCTSCPPGEKCPYRDGSGNSKCNAGEYSIGRATSCTSCPKGFACTNSTSDYKVECQLGTFSTGQQTACTPCPAGS